MIFACGFKGNWGQKKHRQIFNWTRSDVSQVNDRALPLSFLSCLWLNFNRIMAYPLLEFPTLIYIRCQLPLFHLCKVTDILLFRPNCCIQKPSSDCGWQFRARSRCPAGPSAPHLVMLPPSPHRTAWIHCSRAPHRRLGVVELPYSQRAQIIITHPWSLGSILP